MVSLTTLQYREILLSKISQSLESDQICVAEFISVCRECDDSSDLEVTASVALILKELSTGEDEEEEEEIDVKNQSLENESVDDEERETSNIEDPGPQITSNDGIPLQLWRYVNGGPLLDYSDIQSCCLFSTVRSFNWKEFGHTLRCISGEYKASEEPVLHAPSLTLTPKRDCDEIYHYSTPAADSGDEVESPRSSNSRKKTVNKMDSNSWSESQDEIGYTRKRRKQQLDKIEGSPPVRKRVTPCQLIIYLDVNASNGKYQYE